MTKTAKLKILEGNEEFLNISDFISALKKSDNPELSKRWGTVIEFCRRRIRTLGVGKEEWFWKFFSEYRAKIDENICLNPDQADKMIATLVYGAETISSKWLSKNRIKEFQKLSEEMMTILEGIRNECHDCLTECSLREDGDTH